MTKFETRIESPLGILRLLADESGLTGVYMARHTREPIPSGAGTLGSDHPVLSAAASQLSEYFAGTRREFDLPLTVRGTDFQQRVWRALRAIPYADTWTYGRLAAAIGQPTGSRAVGGANGRNPISIIVPCHRVIGSDGSMTGYGGGEHHKRWLLDHEARVGGFQLR